MRYSRPTAQDFHISEKTAFFLPEIFTQPCQVGDLTLLNR